MSVDSLLEILKSGQAHLAIVLLNSGLPLPSAEKHPFLLNEFLSKSKDFGAHTYITPSNAHPFYQSRMQVAKFMMENGFLLQDFVAKRDQSARHEEHEIELLCRNYLSAGMGDIQEIPVIEAQDRIACLSFYLQDRSFVKKGLSGGAFSQIAYAEPEGFTKLLIENGFFDEALKDEKRSALQTDLLNMEKRVGIKTFASPNSFCRSLIIERCLTLGFLNYDHMRQQGFTLFDVGRCPSLTLKMMTEGNFVLPRIDEKTLDGRGPGWFYTWSDKQIETWGEFDPEGMMLKIQFLQKDKESTFLTRENFKNLVLSPTPSLSFYIGYEDETEGQLSPQHKLERRERLALVFAQAEGCVLKKELRDKLTLKSNITTVHKM